MKKRLLFAVIVILTLGGVGVHHPIAAQQPYQLVEVASGFSKPLYVTHAGDERLFVVEQSGKIRIVQDGAILEPPFLDVSSIISPEALTGDYSERGLLGLAFHPDYAENGTFFINYTDLNGDTVVARYAVSADDPNVADPNSVLPILQVAQPYPNHNGGHLAFGPDGYLYIALGDGGSGGDPQGNGQNVGTLLGSILRVDVNTDQGYLIPPDNPFVNQSGVQPEIWSWGWRNPWRFSFDRQTGDMWIADVGQNEWEEVNFESAGGPGGLNYGWNAYEASYPYSGAEAASDVVMPILEYSHDEGCSISGGYVYRGPAIPSLQGTYFYGDWCSGLIWTAQSDASGAWTSTVSLQSGLSISSFGEDAAGELYVVDYNGTLYRIAE
ncbi:MAG TPA: PQQ-dependent sugar dehydrogenase [Aggregatilineaceae bacterium]|nr:PQQ-dependent sugar dehydrogenase [Aggregatilineaceae bacterium]